MVREEMLENPVLEDSVESAAEQQKASAGRDGAPTPQAERIGETEMPVARAAGRRQMETTPEVKADTRSDEAVKEFDWEGYLENQAASPPLPSYRAEQRGPAVARGDADPGHLAVRPPRVAAQAGPLRAAGGRRSRCSSSATSPPTATWTSRSRRSPRRPAVTVEVAEAVLKKIQELDPPGVAARNLQECLLIQARARRRRRRRRGRHHHQAPRQPGEEELRRPSPRT